MFSHVFVGVRDFDRALAFYQPVLAVLGMTQRFVERDRPWAGWQMAGQARPLFLIGAPFDGAPASAGNGQMAGFLATTPAQVDAMHAAALAHGGNGRRRSRLAARVPRALLRGLFPGPGWEQAVRGLP